MIRPLLALPLLLIAGTAQAATPITGRWIAKGDKAVVRIERCGKALCGRIERVLKPAPGGATTDIHNSDKSLRNRPLVGLPILIGLTDAGDEWRGRIYNPEDGRTYKASVSRNPEGTLKVRGCFAFICRKHTWQPAR